MKILLIGNRSPELDAAHAGLASVPGVKVSLLPETSERFTLKRDGVISQFDAVLCVKARRMVPLHPVVPIYVIHASLLPRLRGFAPVSWALRTGELIGLTLFRAVQEMDAGPILALDPLPSQPFFAFEARDALVPRYKLLAQKLPGLIQANIGGTPQNSALASYGPPLCALDRLWKWSQPAEEISRIIRGGLTREDNGAILGRLVPEARTDLFYGRHHVRLPDRPWHTAPGQVVLAEADEPDEVPVLCGDGRLLVLTSLIDPIGKEFPAPTILRHGRTRLI